MSQLWFQPHLCMRTTYGHLCFRLPWSIWACSSGNGVQGRGVEWGAWQSQAHESQPWQDPFLVSREAQAGAWEEGLQWQPHPLCIIQQWHLTSMALQAFCVSISGWRATLPHPLWLSPHSQQQSFPEVCSSDPMVQHQCFVCTGSQPHVSGWGTQSCGSNLCRFHSVLPPQTGCCALLQALAVLADLPTSKRAFLDAETSSFLQLPPGAQVPIHFPSFSFSLLSFILSSYVGIFLVPFGIWSPLQVFSKCSVRTVSFVNVFLIHLWRKVNSASSFSSILTPLTLLEVWFSFKTSNQMNL